jgi:hypothetical protein
LFFGFVFETGSSRNVKILLVLDLQHSKKVKKGKREVRVREVNFEERRQHRARGKGKRE